MMKKKKNMMIIKMMKKMIEVMNGDRTGTRMDC
jgi:hypothetical protein